MATGVNNKGILILDVKQCRCAVMNVCWCWLCLKCGVIPWSCVIARWHRLAGYFLCHVGSTHSLNYLLKSDTLFQIINSRWNYLQWHRKCWSHMCSLHLQHLNAHEWDTHRLRAPGLPSWCVAAFSPLSVFFWFHKLLSWLVAEVGTHHMQQYSIEW